MSRHAGVGTVRECALRRSNSAHACLEELSGLSILTNLYLSHNHWTGCIPEGLRDVQANDLWTLGLEVRGS